MNIPKRYIPEACAVQNPFLAALEAVIASKRMREQVRKKIFMKNTKPTTKQRSPHYKKLERGGVKASEGRG